MVSRYIQSAMWLHPRSLFDSAFLVAEIGVLPEDISAVTTLLAAVGHEASRRGLRYGEVDLPYEAPLDAVITDLFGASPERS